MREAEEYRRSSRVKKPMFLKRNICRRCYIPLVYGRTASVRLKREGSFTRLVVRCSLCGYIHRYTIRRRKK